MVSRRTVVVGVVLAFPLLLVFLNLNAVSQRSSATATPKLRAGPKDSQAERGGRAKGTREFFAGVMNAVDDDGAVTLPPWL